MTTQWPLLLRHLGRLSASPDADHVSDAVLLERFVRCGDATAFTALVKRHGAMVLRLCRRVLADAQAAEDAFQATFLVLARRAATVRPGALVPWLHGVARRVAAKSAAQERRRRAEPLAGNQPSDPRPDPLRQVSARELLEIVEQEVRRLPQAYRMPVVLCLLEGHTMDEAARRLGWTVGSVRGRLERGRTRLRERLAGHGWTVAAALAAAEVAGGGRAVPAALAAATARHAGAFAAGQGRIPLGSAARLAEAVLRGTAAGKLNQAGLLALVLVAACGGATVGYRALAAAPPAPANHGGGPGGAAAGRSGSR